jgi:hypothetical protein
LSSWSGTAGSTSRGFLARSESGTAPRCDRGGWEAFGSFVEFQLYRSDETCYCVNTKPETLTIKASEKIFGKIAVQVFSPRNRPEEELFRVRIGEYFGSDMVKWWNYKILLSLRHKQFLIGINVC